LFAGPLAGKLCNDNLALFGIKEKLGFEIFKRNGAEVVYAKSLSKMFFEHH